MSYVLPKIQLAGNTENGGLGLVQPNSNPNMSQGLVLLGNTVVGSDSKQRLSSTPNLADYMGVQNALVQKSRHLSSGPLMSSLVVQNPIQQANPISYVGMNPPVPYVVQPIIIQQEGGGGRRSLKKKKKKGDKSDGPGAAAIENYLDRQNQLMARILRDMKDDKKLDYANQKMQLDHQLLGMGGNRSHSIGTPKGYKNNNNNTSFFPMSGFNPYANQSYSDPRGQMPYGSMSRNNLNMSTYDNNPNRPPNKARGRKLLRGVMWGLALPGMWFISVVKWAEQRREEELRVLEEEIPENLETFLEFAAIAIEKEIKDFATDKNSMVIVNSGNVKSAELDKRCKLITDHIILILDHLSLQLDSGKLSPSFFEFICAISEDDAVIPENFLSGFEITRLYFNMFGNLKYTDEWRTKMISAAFILLKGVLYFLMLRPWTVIPSLQEKQVNIKNMINAGSVLYHVTLELLTEHIPISHRSDGPFKPAPPSFSALDPGKLGKGDIIPDDNSRNVQEVIAGFYSRERLVEFMERRPRFVKEVKEAIVDFLDVLYDLTHNALERKWHVKQRFAAHRPRH